MELSDVFCLPNFYYYFFYTQYSSGCFLMLNVFYHHHTEWQDHVQTNKMYLITAHFVAQFSFVLSIF